MLNLLAIMYSCVSLGTTPGLNSNECEHQPQQLVCYLQLCFNGAHTSQAAGIPALTSLSFSVAILAGHTMTMNRKV